MPYAIVKNNQPVGTFPRVGLDHGCIECRNEFGGKVLLILAPGQWDSVYWVQEDDRG